VIASSATAVSTQTAKASWRWWYFAGEHSGYCANGRLRQDFRTCPENRSVTATNIQRRKTSKSGRVEYEIERSLFGGNESRLAQFGWFDYTCRAPKPDLRVIRQPNKGDLRFENVETTITTSKSALQKKCFGKPVSAISMYYRAGEKSPGHDTIVVDADTKFGHVVRYVISIDIKPAAEAKAPQSGPAQRRVARTVLKGNEARIAAPNYLNADCSSGPLPDLRVVAEPKNGTFRTEETSVAAERPADNSRAACNGKPVNAVAVYYKPKDEFAGDDEMAIDVDFHDGNVRRFVYAITVR
jgi:hypothetical protein